MVTIIILSILKYVSFSIFKADPFAGSVWSHTDLVRLKRGGVGAQVISYIKLLAKLVVKKW